MPTDSPTSAKFGFLVAHDRLLDHLGALAERYFADDRSTCLLKLRQFGEVLAQRVAARAGQLLGWFDEYPAPRSWIALRLLERRPSSQSALDHIVAVADGRVRLLAQLVRGAPEALPALDLALRAHDPNGRLFAARLAGMVGDPRSTEALWTLVNFSDDRYYPADALLRHEAMAALLRIALATHWPPPRPKKTMVLAPQRSATAGWTAIRDRRRRGCGFHACSGDRPRPRPRPKMLTKLSEDDGDPFVNDGRG